MKTLELITRFEEDGLRFYEAIAKHAQNPAMKELCTLLADNQKRHLNRMQHLRKRMETGTTDIPVRGVVAAFDEFRKVIKARDMNEALANDPDAFNHIHKAEGELIRCLEKGLDGEHVEENNRRFLKKLVEDERHHLEEIENIYEFKEAPRTYLAWGEFSNLRDL